MNYSEDDTTEHNAMNSQDDNHRLPQAENITPDLVSMSGLGYPSLNSKFTAETETPCPCCKELSLEKSYQTPIVKGKSGYWQIHCKNPLCPMYGRTLTIAAFMAEAIAKANNS